MRVLPRRRSRPCCCGRCRGVSASTTAQLHPIDALPALRSPLLIAAGAVDRHTTLAETEHLHAAAGSTDKSLWIVPGAAHVDLHAFAPAEYERRVGGFMQDRLRTAA